MRLLGIGSAENTTRPIGLHLLTKLTAGPARIRQAAAHVVGSAMGKLSRDKGKVGEREVAALLPGFHIEVKRTEKLNLEAALAQADVDCGGNTPVVFHRKSKNGWVVIMRAGDFLKMVRGF